ncbi:MULTISPECIES: bifunctional PIG-L family deacetylase/class I SAM-dependent methyltransferase [unclassified Arthrobacter]|uniref:bifunctional PIG-L family deacetylase/class I SAM-dependent methyltransferase n=1 Tax=unclassified Arthrobacter TaxID=235627 RepID=UPI00159E97FA|nr:MULTISPECIES: bifunctional PIG-L family deacetylase/class I SAM-dependent methyltransferase [unclassified Arthrobacter]MCQ9165994.1 bifunctional PIG-L family deacetylase/class I SAM-dependent methyltransferase [Arthrobacter sp. STN4]NVM98704.1 bifunctional PIG-L family deacetylase/class I SAM-dependent methyltransferase [Arthrobacter sp. SDTb3-6]
MVAFTHDQPTTAESEWLGSPRIARMLGLAIDWAEVPKLVVLAAHPDDETLGAAGLLQHAAAHQVPIEVLVATWGENSHPHSPTHTPEDLAAVRAVELRKALAAVAPAAVHRFLDIPDGGVHAQRKALESEIIAAVSGSHGTLIVAPWSGDGHTDHDAAGSAAARAARATNSLLLEYPIWLWHWGTPAHGQVPWPALRRLDLTRQQQAAKAAAIQGHTSQIAPLSAASGDEPLLGPGVLSHFHRPFETFIDTAGHFTREGPAYPGWLRTQFDAVHACGAEPWAPGSWYEQRKRSLLLAVLPRERFESALELGCSTGALTADLALRCAHVLGVDASPEAVATARGRTAALSNADIVEALLPGDWPEGRFDLFVLSETGYYFSETGLGRLLDHVAASTLPDGVLAACHWRHPISGWPLDGADVHRLLRADPRLALAGSYSEDDFVLETFRIRALP